MIRSYGQEYFSSRRMALIRQFIEALDGDKCYSFPLPRHFQGACSFKDLYRRRLTVAGGIESLPATARSHDSHSANATIRIISPLSILTHLVSHDFIAATDARTAFFRRLF